MSGNILLFRERAERKECHPERFFLHFRFGIQDRVFGRMVPNIVSNFKTEFQLEEVDLWCSLVFKNL